MSKVFADIRGCWSAKGRKGVPKRAEPLHGSNDMRAKPELGVLRRQNAKNRQRAWPVACAGRLEPHRGLPAPCCGPQRRIEHCRAHAVIWNPLGAFSGKLPRNLKSWLEILVWRRMRQHIGPIPVLWDGEGCPAGPSWAPLTLTRAHQYKQDPWRWFGTIRPFSSVRVLVGAAPDLAMVPRSTCGC